MRTTALTIYIFLLCLSTVAAESGFFKEFKSNYELLDLDLLNNPSQVATISNFVYQKDVATFTFVEGEIHLLRFVNGRPTTAIFIGQGRAQIEVPSALERKSMISVTGDSLVDEQFSVCFIRMADDLDLKLKERFSFENEQLRWRDFNAAKEAQGELFFKPIIDHRFDNYFQILRSVYERSEDGYFWIDFNRYNFVFDPNRAEEVVIDYELEGGNILATHAAVFQRQEENIYDNSAMSDFSFLVSPIKIYGSVEMGGLDGHSLVGGNDGMKLVVNTDSVRFVSIFLHFNLKLDSMHFKGRPVDFYRRKDFDFVGIILPEYHYRNDTLDFTFWCRGKNFDCLFPYVEDPRAVPHELDIIFPRGYNYVAPDAGKIERYDKKRNQFKIFPVRPIRKLYFQGYASGYDTLSIQSEMGIMINFLKSREYNKRMYCFIPDKVYEKTTMDAFNFMAGRFGGPPGTFVEYVYPAGMQLTQPGLIQLPQIACVREGTFEAIGGFHALAGYSVAKQWFGSLVQPATRREQWLLKAVPEYMSLMFLQSNLDGGEFYSNLANRRDSVQRVAERGWDMPLAVGVRTTASIPFKTIHSNKGTWVLHMLRFLMFDLESGSDRMFMKFMQELVVTFNNSKFTNNDFVLLAEKHYGQSLDWFFEQWLYGTNYPHYDVTYSFVEDSGEYFVNVGVTTENIPADFRMPVIMRIVNESGETFLRETTRTGNQKFELGPFESKPKEFYFNEFFSVLSKDNVKKR